VAMRASNGKLRGRAQRMLVELGGVTPEEADGLLVQVQYDIRAALLMARRGYDAATAQARLQAAGGHLRHALELDAAHGA